MTESGNARQTAMERTLSISEVLDRVLSFNDRADSSRCACVCKAWLEVALDHVWREVDTVKALFQLLGTLERSLVGKSYVCINFDFAHSTL